MSLRGAARSIRPVGLASGLALLALIGSAGAQAPSTPEPADRPSTAEPADAAETEVMRARILARIGRFEEALAAYGALLARRPEDRGLREDFAEVLLDAGLHEQAAISIDRFLAEDPASVRLRRLRARLDLERGDPRAAARRLEALARELPRDASLTADLAAAELAAGAWTRALGLYSGLLERDPENAEIRAAHREILLGHARALELRHYSLLQQTAAHHVEEAVWRAWLADRWWVRAGTRYGSYHQDALSGQPGFTREISTVLASLGFQPKPGLSLWMGLEEARRREDAYRTTFRLGGSFDDAKATTVALEAAVRELLTNPVTALTRDGTTDRVSVDVARRILNPVVLAGRYDFRHYRASGDDLGNRWEVSARAEIELLRERVQVTLIPQVFFAQYTPTAGSPLRDEITFLRREDVVASGILIGWDITPALRLQAGSVGRRDLYRALTSWEVSGEGRWRIRPWLEGRVLYNRNTESTTIGGKEELFLGRLEILH
jgi:tetratricopeptide (TPR) repeat protein